MTVCSNYIYDMREAGYSLFGLYGASPNCECGDPDCKALFKHPRISNWQNIPFYSEEQFETMCDIGHMATGYGVLVKDLLIIDIDVRNSGDVSFKKLCADIGIDLLDKCGFVVETGSADGSKHLYFKAPSPAVAMVQSHPNYKGIDFKSTGFCVAPGSLHRSGNRYEIESGAPDEITEPPIALVQLLEKRSHYRTQTEHGAVDVSLEELRDTVMAIQNPDGSHDKWLTIGMGLHDVTGGSQDGLAIWDEWSQQFPHYEAKELDYRYHSFGKSAERVSYGSILHLAKEDGYIQPVTFDATPYVIETSIDPLDISHIDIRKPHGFAGVLTEWINAQCLYPRENLAAAAALYVLSCVGGMRHKDDLTNMSTNFIAFGVAGSGTGKEAVLQAVHDCLKAAGVLAATHGKFKSEQEAVRNLLRHQASYYVVDELGIELRKVANAAKKGGAAYLEGLIGFLMSVYSKANGIMPVSGDLKEAVKESIKTELARVNKQADDDGEDKVKHLLDALYQQLDQADQGIVNPFMSMFGMTTPVTFDELVDQEMATNGFIARSTIFREAETNPRRKNKFKAKPMDLHLQTALAALYSGGNHDPDLKRVQRIGEPALIYTNDEAQEALDQVYEYFHDLAEDHKSKSGLEAIARRGWEICSKVSLLTAMPTKLRTKQDVLYGFAVAKADIDRKIQLAYANSNQQGKQRQSAIMMDILSKLDKETGQTLSALSNLMKRYTKEDIEKTSEELIKQRKAVKIEEKHKGNGSIVVKYFGVEK